MAERGTIFDPQVCLVFQNYIDHRGVYAKSGFTEQSFESLAKAIPTATDYFRPGTPRTLAVDAASRA